MVKICKTDKRSNERGKERHVMELVMKRPTTYPSVFKLSGVNKMHFAESVQNTKSFLSKTGNSILFINLKAAHWFMPYSRIQIEEHFRFIHTYPSFWLDRYLQRMTLLKLHHLLTLRGMFCFRVVTQKVWNSNKRGEK